ncbi:MAG: hypothetical protein A2026_18335 [Deltaproteobacteria bacterium RBG_19FT_COMBO_46_12]|nr:MAG: hypothetical protein A2026_18335 [Deltaproteobacteria bacterium RBG_19FT_COMBO_46_12]
MKISVANIAKWCLIIFLPMIFILRPSFGSNLVIIKTSSTGYQPQFQVSENKIYYVWHEYDGPFRQIFTAEMNIDGTGWKAVQRTSGRYDKVFPQLQVAGGKTYYVWQQSDVTKNRQIWTAEMNVEGIGWKEVQRTNTPFDKQFPQLQVFGDKTYYTWNESDGRYRQIWTAEMNIDGAGWNATKRTVSPFDKFEPQLQLVGGKIYLVWRESDGSHFQIWTAVMNQDGTGWESKKHTTSPQDKHNPQFQVNGGKIYLTWHEADGPDWRKARYQIWTAGMDVDGTGWRAIQRTMAGFDKYTPQLQVYGGKIYHVWEESDGKHRQIWTAVVNQDGTGWKAEKRTKSPYGKYDPKFQIAGNKIYYVWHEDHGPTEPIWVAIESPTIR